MGGKIDTTQNWNHSLPCISSLNTCIHLYFKKVIVFHGKENKTAEAGVVSFGVHGDS